MIRFDRFKKNLVFRVIQNRAFAGRRRSTMSRAVAVATGLQEQQIPRNHQRVEWQSRRLSLRGKRGVTHPNRKWNLHVYFGFTWSEEIPCTTILIGGLVATLSGSAHIRTQMFWFSSSSSPILLFDLYMCTCILKSCWSFIFRMIKMLRVSYFDRVLVFDQFWRAIVQEFVLTHHGKKPRATQRELGSLGIVNLLWSLMARFAFGRKMSRKKWGGENKCFFPIQNLDKIHTMSKHQKIDINNETWVRSGYAVPGIPSWFVIIFFSFILLALYLFRTLHPSPCQVSLLEKHFKDSAKISAMESEPHGAGQDPNMLLNSEEFWLFILNSPSLQFLVAANTGGKNRNDQCVSMDSVACLGDDDDCWLSELLSSHRSVPCWHIIDFDSRTKFEFKYRFDEFTLNMIMSIDRLYFRMFLRFVCSSSMAVYLRIQ